MSYLVCTDDLVTLVEAQDLSNNTPVDAFGIEPLPYGLEAGEMLNRVRKTVMCNLGGTHAWVQVFDRPGKHLAGVFGPVRAARKLIDERVGKVVV